MGYQKSNLFLVLVVYVLGIWAAHTPRPTKEPNEGEGVSFVYNGHSHHLIIRTKSGKDMECYVITLSDAERMDVHSDAGMRTIELKYLAMLVAAQPTTLDTLSAFDQKSCGHAQRNDRKYHGNAYDHPTMIDKRRYVQGIVEYRLVTYFTEKHDEESVTIKHRYRTICFAMKATYDLCSGKRGFIHLLGS